MVPPVLLPRMALVSPASFIQPVGLEPRGLLKWLSGNLNSQMFGWWGAKKGALHVALLDLQAKFSVTVRDAGFKEDVILDVDGSRISGLLLRNFHDEGYRRVRIFRCMQNWMREVVFAGSTAGQLRADQGLECFNDEVASTAKNLTKSLQKPRTAPTAEDIMMAVLADDEARVGMQVEAKVDNHAQDVNEASASSAPLGLVQDLLKPDEGDKEQEEEAADEGPKGSLMGRQLVTQKALRIPISKPNKGQPKSRPTKRAIENESVLGDADSVVRPEDSVSQVGKRTKLRAGSAAGSQAGGGGGGGKKPLPELVRQVQKRMTEVNLFAVLDGQCGANDEYQLQRAIHSLRQKDMHHGKVHEGEALWKASKLASKLTEQVENMDKTERHQVILELLAADVTSWPPSMQERLLACHVKDLMQELS